LSNPDKIWLANTLLNASSAKERRRTTYFSLIIIVVFLGLGSRYFSKLLPGWVELYAGDALWALNVFLMLGFIFLRKNGFWIAFFALIFSCLIEVSQLYHTPWINNIRAYKLGSVILGFGFRWSDMLCYFAGITSGLFIEKIKITEKFLFRAK
jgi:hypothetical protein